MKLAIFTTTAVALFGAVLAAPVAREDTIVQRDVHVLGVRFVPRDGGLPTYRGVQYAANSKRDDVNVLGLRHIADDGDLAKRGELITPKIINREAEPEPQDIPEEDAVKSDGGAVVPYDKRQDDTIPAEIAVKSDGGDVVPYAKRQEGDIISAEIAVKSDNGVVVAYVKRQEDAVIPAEVAVKSDGSGVVPY